MKPIMLLLLVLLCSLSLQAQEKNPWEYTPGKNPWLTEEEQKREAEKNKTKDSIAAKQIVTVKAVMNQPAETKVNPADTSTLSLIPNKQTTSVTVKNKKLNPNDTLINYYLNGDYNLHQLGTKDAEKHYDDYGYFGAGFFITLIPIIGNPIVWGMSASKPSLANLNTRDNPRNALLEIQTYNEAYKIKARKKRAGKLMIGNLFGNVVKTIVFVALIN